MSDACPPVAFSLLGGVRVALDGTEVRSLGGPQPRAVLAALLAADGRTVTTGALVEAVWGEDPPVSAVSTLHSYVSRLRAALGPAGALLRRHGEGYLLDAPAGSVDWRRFEHLVEHGRAALEAGDPATARARLVEAEGLWRGPALGDLADRPFAAGLVARWDGLRAAAAADRQEADLRLGRHAALLGELAEAVRAAPLDEARWRRLALASYRCGRQADALAAVAEARRTLVDELGVEPGPALRELELQVLRQDPALDLVPAARAAVPAQRPAGTASTRDALVGRTHELAVLEAVLAESAEHARAGVVEGEAGIGKTRLLEELAARATAQGALVLWGRSHESGAAPAFWPWLPVLGALRDRAPDDAEPGLTALLEARAGDLATGLFSALDDVAAAVRRTSREVPVVVLLDDLQWADAASLSLLTFLAGHLEHDAVLLLATVRLGAGERPPELVDALAAVARRRGSRRLLLGGLRPEDTARLVSQTTEVDVPPDVALAIHARAEGNPFFAGQLAQLLGESRPGEVATAPVPAGVGDVVRQRLARLPAATTDLLQVAAVVGRDVDLRLLAAVTGRPVAACLADLEPAVALHLLTDDADAPAVLRFVHALVREVLADDLTTTRRASVHLQIADALADEGDEQTELRAEHLWSASPLVDASRAAEALEDAAEVALRRFALASAEHLLERAVRLRRSAGTSAAHADAELQALVRLTSVRRALRGFGGVSDLLDRAETLATRLGRQDVELELQWARWALADTSCDFTTGDAIAERFRDLAATTDDPVLRQLGLHVWGIQCWHHGRLVEMRDSLDAAFAVAERAPERIPVYRAGTTSALRSFQAERHMLAAGFRIAAHGLVGDWPDSAARFDALSAGNDRYGAAMLAMFGACVAACAGDVDRVERVARPVADAHADELLSFWGGQAQLHLGWVLVERGEVDAGTALVERGLRTYTDVGMHTGLGMHLANIAIGLARQGDVERAAAYAEQAQAELDAYGERWPVPLVLLAQAEVARARGEDATERYVAARRAAEQMGAAVLVERVARAAARLSRARPASW